MMTIDEAIKVNEEEAEAEEKLGNPLGAEAIRLGIEALKAVKNARANNYYTPIPSLPGETEE